MFFKTPLFTAAAFTGSLTATSIQAVELRPSQSQGGLGSALFPGPDPWEQRLEAEKNQAKTLFQRSDFQGAAEIYRKQIREIEAAKADSISQLTRGGLPVAAIAAVRSAIFRCAVSMS